MRGRPPTEPTGTYGLAREQGKLAMRDALLETCCQILETEGAQGLTVRRIAERAGCSTTVIYSHFQDKEGIIEALYLEGFRRLAQAVNTVNLEGGLTASLTGKVVLLFDRYRQFAHANPTFYSVMFERATPGFQPSKEARDQGWTAIEPLRVVVQHCLDAGLMHATDAEEGAARLWAAAHGVVSLELAGNLPDQEMVSRMYRDLIAGQLLSTPSV